MAARRTQAQQRQPEQQRSAAPILTTGRDALADLLDDDDGSSIVKTDNDALASITKSEVGMQLDAAHRWPRSIARFMEDATALATMSKSTAQSCIYTLPVRKGGDKPITGPSVRLAEMCATSWGNLHTGARMIDIGQRDVTAQALAWDLEKNLRLSIEVKRGIMTSGDYGKVAHRFGDDMIRVTSMAAISIALRNAIFRIIPRALVNHVYEQAERTATGVVDGTFKQERDAAIGWFVNKKGVTPERIYARLGITRLEDMTPELLAALYGIGSAIKARESSVDEAFPPPGAAKPAGPRKSAGQALDDMVSEHQSAKKSQPPPANDDAQLTAAAVHDALSNADDDWEPANRIDIIKGWSPAEQRIAYDWAVAFSATPDNEGPPEQPEFTMIGREPGSDG
jgi:hypothetical protein